MPNDTPALQILIGLISLQAFHHRNHMSIRLAFPKDPAILRRPWRSQPGGYVDCQYFALLWFSTFQSQPSTYVQRALREKIMYTWPHESCTIFLGGGVDSPVS